MKTAEYDKEQYRVSKARAAAAQIETAIILLFSNLDMISVHTLIAAAYTIIEDLNKKDGKGSSMFKDCSAYLPQRAKEWRTWVSTPENFLKHADRDPDSILLFKPEITFILVMETLKGYLEREAMNSVICEAFHVWMTASWGDQFAVVYNVSPVHRDYAKAVRLRYEGHEHQKFYEDLKSCDYDLEKLLGVI